LSALEVNHNLGLERRDTVSALRVNDDIGFVAVSALTVHDDIGFRGGIQYVH
jgi:hypothetical protein